MPKPDDTIAQVDGYQIFRKSDSDEYEVVGPAAKNSPIAYTMIRGSAQTFKKIEAEIRRHQRRNGK